MASKKKEDVQGTLTEGTEEDLKVEKKDLKAEKKVVPVQPTEAEKIWNKIKDLPIDIFALPDQTVERHVRREAAIEKADPSGVHLILKSPAVLPALEDALKQVRLGKNKLGQPLVFSLTPISKYTVVRIVPRDA